MAALPQLLHAFYQTRVVGGDGAAVAVGAEVLRRVEAEGRGVPPRARASAFESRAVRLRRVLDDEEAAARGEIADRLKVGHLPVEVHGDDGTRAPRERALKAARVKRVGFGTDV